MNVVDPHYATAYVVCLIIAACGVTLRFARKSTVGEQMLSLVLVMPCFVMYFVGMHRVGGEDYDNYFNAYYNLDGPGIPDPGYTALTTFAHAIGVDFSGFLFLIGVFTFTVMWRVARVRNADPVVVFVFYLCHLAIGRDLSQIRIGLAVAIYLFGQIQDRRWLRYAIYVAAASIHITVVVLIAVWAYSRWTARFKGRTRWLALYAPILGFAALGSSLLQIAAFVDPRVEIYLAWDEDSFGAPLSSYGALARTVVVLLVYIGAMRRFKNLKLQPYIAMELAGAAVLLGLSQFAIFASRLSNVAISMYPIGLGIVALAYQNRTVRPETFRFNALTKLAVISTLVVLLGRPASFEVLAKVVPTAYVTIVELG
jgi:hypothetical protein